MTCIAEIFTSRVLMQYYARTISFLQRMWILVWTISKGIRWVKQFLRIGKTLNFHSFGVRFHFFGMRVTLKNLESSSFCVCSSIIVILLFIAIHIYNTAIYPLILIYKGWWRHLWYCRRLYRSIIRNQILYN